MTIAPRQKIAYVGRPPAVPARSPGPIGLRGVALLRRVRDADGPYRCLRNADEGVAWRCIEAGLVRLDSRDDEVLHLTPEGRAYLDRVTRAT